MASLIALIRRSLAFFLFPSWVKQEPQYLRGKMYKYIQQNDVYNNAR
jgi:hypothetical protein